MAFHLFDCVGSAYLGEDEKAYPAAAASRAMQSAMQEIGEIVFLRHLYHDIPNDLFELIISLFSDVNENGRERGGLNIFRLVNKRLKQVVESCATKLRNPSGSEGTTDLPSALLSRCHRIQDLSCFSWSLSSLDGLQRLSGLQRLFLYGEKVGSLEPLSACTKMEKIEIYRASLISDLAPLGSCTNLKRILIDGSRVVDLSPLSPLSLLESLTIRKDSGLPSIQNLSPLSRCARLNELFIGGNVDIEDLSPLTQCMELEELRMERCIRVENLMPLASLQGLLKLSVRGIDTRASVFPLSFCAGLKVLGCGLDAVDLDELRKMRQELKIESD